MKNKFKNKVAGILLVVAMAFGAFIVPSMPVAHAQNSTNASLFALISDLQARIAVLLSQVPRSTTGVPAYVFTRNLTIGSRGSDVTTLQNFLISRNYVISAGATGYFGAQTQRALAIFQESNGISPAVGFFGPITRARINMVFVPTLPITPIPTPTYPGLQGGAGGIVVTERTQDTENEVGEGDNNIRVIGIEIKPFGSDVAIKSAQMEFEHVSSNSGSDDIADYFDEISIIRDTRVVTRVDADDLSEDDGIFTANISFANEIIRENDVGRFYIAVSVSSNIDSNDLGENWEVGFGQIRFEDGTGAVLTNNAGTGVDGLIMERFMVDAGDDLDDDNDANAKLIVRGDDDDVNDSHDVSVDDSTGTDDVDVLSLILEAGNEDIQINSMMFDISASGAGVTEIANEFRLMMNGDEIGRVRIDSSSSDDNNNNNNDDDDFDSTSDVTRTLTIDEFDGDIVIDEGDEVSFVLVADINEIGGTNNEFDEDDEISISLNADDIIAEDESGDELSESELSGSAKSNDIRFTLN